MPAKGARAPASGNGNKTSASDAARIQSTQAKTGAATGKNTFASRSQSAAARNAAPGATPSPPAPALGAKGAKGGAKVA